MIRVNPVEVETGGKQQGTGTSVLSKVLAVVGACAPAKRADCFACKEGFVTAAVEHCDR